MENSYEYSTEELNNIKEKLDAYYDEIISNRINKVLKIHSFYKTHKRFPKSNSIDAYEKSLGHLLNKMNNPENYKILEKEIQLMHSLDWK